MWLNSPRHRAILLSQLRRSASRAPAPRRHAECVVTADFGVAQVGDGLGRRVSPTVVLPPRTESRPTKARPASQAAVDFPRQQRLASARCAACSRIPSRPWWAPRWPRRLSGGPAGDRRHGGARLPRVAVRARGDDGLERAVVRRPPRARLLDAVRAAGGGTARRGSACSARSRRWRVRAVRARRRAVAGGGAAAAWLFAAGVLSNVVIGRMPFTLGIALAVAAWLCAERRRPAGGARRACWRSRACWRARWPARSWCSARPRGPPGPAGPRSSRARAVARAARDRRRRRDGRAVPGGRRRPLRGDGVLADARRRAGRRRAARARRRRALRAGGAAVHRACSSRAFVVPTPFGQNALRLRVLLGPALLVLAPRAARAACRARGRASSRCSTCSGCRPCGRWPRRTATRPPSEAFFADARAFLERACSRASASRCAFTHNHWEAAHLASVVPLARGWERQLDEKANPLFYDGRPLTAERYHRWLRDDAVRWVALPDAPLDYSAQAEARLLERGVPYLKLAHALAATGASGRSRDPTPPASAARACSPPTRTGSRSTPAGPTVVRQRYTRLVALRATRA